MRLIKALKNPNLAKRRVKEYYEAQRMVTWFTERHTLTEGGSFTFNQRLEPVLTTVRSKGTIALDAGCGPGLFTKEIAKTSAHVVLRQNCIDVAICMGVIQHLPNPQKAVREIANATSPGGSLVLATMNLLSPLYLLFRIYVRLSRLLKKDFVHTSESPIERAFHRHYIEKTLTNAGFSVAKFSALCLPPAEVPGPVIAFFVMLDRLTRRFSRLCAIGADLIIEAQKPANTFP